MREREDLVRDRRRRRRESVRGGLTDLRNWGLLLGLALVVALSALALRGR